MAKKADPVAEAQDVLDPLMKELKAQAEGRQAIAEADLATAVARMPKLPEAFPSSEVDASEADASFATVNSYRAARECSIVLADEVRDAVSGVDNPVIWITSTAHVDAFDAAHVVTSSLADIDRALKGAIMELTPMLPTQPAPGEQEGDISDGSGNRARPVLFALPAPAILASAISSGLPLLFDALSTKSTVKTSAAALDDNAILDLVTNRLTSNQTSERGPVRVLRADATTPVSETYREKIEAARQQIHELRELSRRAGDALRKLSAELGPQNAKIDLARSFVEAVIAKDATTLYPTTDVDRVVELSEAVQGDVERIALLSARIGFADQVATAAEAGVLALTAAEPGGTSLVARASFANRLAAASEGTNSNWLRLSVNALDAGATSIVVDNKVAHDRAIHLGSATVTYRLTDQSGEVVSSNTFVDVAGSVVRLDSGTHSWLQRA